MGWHLDNLWMIFFTTKWPSRHRNDGNWIGVSPRGGPCLKICPILERLKMTCWWRNHSWPPFFFWFTGLSLGLVDTFHVGFCHIWRHLPEPATTFVFSSHHLRQARCVSSQFGDVDVTRYVVNPMPKTIPKNTILMGCISHPKMVGWWLYSVSPCFSHITWWFWFSPPQVGLQDTLRRWCLIALLLIVRSLDQGRLD
jgi:hypothetical protein